VQESRLTFEALETRLFRHGVEFCAGLVDLGHTRSSVVNAKRAASTHRT
jgi:hypothetical protein